ncbi:MAG: LacI family DNA-binding transcriptional regulator [Arachnia sp.]
MHAPRPRLADLATRAGVSTATVSRVLNGKPGISTSTRDAVLSAAAGLGYDVPGATLTPHLVAIMTPELSNPSFAAFAEAVDSLLATANQPSVMCPAGPAGTSEADYLEMLTGVDLAGVITVSGIPADVASPNDPYHRMIDSGVPVVFINGFSDDLEAAFYSTSDAEGVRAAVEHLRALGHERIGLTIGPRRYIPATRKESAFLASGFTGSDVESTVFTVEGGQLAASRLLDSGHTALVCGSDLMALGAIRAVRARGLEVPRDVSVVGYDDSPMMAFTDPALTTIRQPVRAIARAAVDALLRARDGGALDPAEVLFHPDLIIRRSTGPTQ